MEKISLTGFTAPFYNALAAFTQKQNWRLKTVPLLLLSVLLFQFPAYKLLYADASDHTLPNQIWVNFFKQVAHPFANNNTVSDSHQSKMVFRLAVPLVARLLHLNLYGVLVLQLLLGVVMLWVLLTLIARITQDRPTAVLFVLGACFTYYGGNFLRDVFGFLDAFSYALLVLLLASRRPVVLLLLSTVGCFLDERFLVASLLAVLWHALREPHAYTPRLERFALTWASAAVVAGWLTYGALRLGLSTHYGLKSYGGGVGLDVLRTTMERERTALGFISGLEAFWVVLALALLVLAVRRRWGLLSLLVLAFLPIAAGAFLVHDVTRSLAYGFPVVLLALVVLAQYFTRSTLRHLALLTVVFTALIPNYFYQGDIGYAESIFEKLAGLVIKHL